MTPASLSQFYSEQCAIDRWQHPPPPPPPPPPLHATTTADFFCAANTPLLQHLIMSTASPPSQRLLEALSFFFVDSTGITLTPRLRAPPDSPSPHYEFISLALHVSHMQSLTALSVGGVNNHVYALGGPGEGFVLRL
jgi:hypothetical protein